MAKQKLFIAHPKAVADEALDALKVQIEELVRAKNPGKDIEVVLGRDDFHARAVTLGGWEPWSRNVVTGINTVTGQPLFSAIIIPALAGGLAVGKATADMVSLALSMARPVRVFAQGQLIPVKGVSTINARDYKAGWSLTI